MTKCENCVKSDVCAHRANIKNDTYAYMGVIYDTENCPHYKDESLFVELPCKFGEKIYVVPSRTHIPKPLETKLLAIGIDDDGDIVYNPNEYPEGVFGVSGGILGETVFLTKEEAERKLREVGE